MPVKSISPQGALPSLQLGYRDERVSQFSNWLQGLTELSKMLNVLLLQFVVKDTNGQPETSGS